MLQKLKPYIQLTRLDKPTGYLLLFLPCLFGILLASGHVGDQTIYTIILFFFGSILMRSSGCIINDIWDRKIDAKVIRTKNRPLASGSITLINALILLFILLLLSLLIALELPSLVFKLALLSLPMVVLYPLMKRFFFLPQLFLGLTFNFGVLMGYAAIANEVSIAAIIAYIGYTFWTLGYDTIYAHQDIKDDRKLKIKSAALFFNDKSKQWVGGFYSIFIATLAIVGHINKLGFAYHAALFVAALFLALQLLRVDLKKPEQCMAAFKSNVIIGFIVAAGLLLV